jgi:hypothetical protein
MTIYVEHERSDFWQLAKDPAGDYIDPLGPKNCQTHAASRSIMRANEGVKPAGITGIWPPTGAAIRKYTGDTVGGTNHSQMATVARERYGTVLVEHRRLPFDDFIDLAEETRGLQLSLWYRRIRDTASRRGSFTFYQNHEFFIGGVDRDRGVFTDVVDSLADGRYAGIYHGPGEYPISLLRMAAGELNVASNPDDYVALGVGLCYALATRATGDAAVSAIVPHVVLNAPAPSERNVMVNQSGRTITSSHVMSLAKGQPIFRYPGGPKITEMSAAGKVADLGNAGIGWRQVRVVTGAPYKDKVSRPTGAYVPTDAGPITAR